MLNRIEVLSKNKGEYQNKDVYFSEYDFNINTDRVTYIENSDGTYHSYTFTLIATTVTDTLENLVLSLKTDGSYETMVIRYILTPSEQQIIDDGGYINLEDKVDAVLINDQSLVDDIFSKVVYDDSCLVHEYMVGPCLGGFWQVHGSVYNDLIGGMCGGSTSLIVGTTLDQECLNSTNQTGGGQTGSEQDGNGTPSGDGGILTAPLPPCTGRNCPQEFDPSHDRNCEELHKISTQPTFQNEFLNLENNLSSQIEKGFALIAVPFQPLMAAQPKNASSSCSEISIPVNPFIFAFMHTHPSGCINGTQPMFGPGDIKALYDFSQNFNPDFDYTYDNSIFTIFMTVGSYHYAIKINDFSKLEKINSIYQNKDSKEMFIEDLDRAYSNSSNNPYSTSGTQTQLAKAFLKVMSSPAYDFGISLYKTSHTDINTDTSNWKRLKIDENGNLDDSQTCN